MNNTAEEKLFNGVLKVLQDFDKEYAKANGQ